MRSTPMCAIMRPPAGARLLDTLVISSGTPDAASLPQMRKRNPVRAGLPAVVDRDVQASPGILAVPPAALPVRVRQLRVKEQAP